MNISDKKRKDWIGNIVQMNTYLQKPQGDEGLLTLILVGRFFVLLGVVFRFGVNRQDYPNASLFNAVRIATLIFFAYFLILGYLKLIRYQAFISRTSKLLQTAFDIIAFSAFYLLTGDAESDIFMFYLLPLVVAFEYFDLVTSLAILVFTSLAFAGVLWGITTFLIAYPQMVLWKVFLPREVFFLAVILTYLFYRRFRASAELAKRKEDLLHRFRKIGEGLYVTDNEYRLLYINERLRRRHGEDFKGKQCFAYFIGHSEPCEACPGLVAKEMGDGHGVTGGLQAYCIDKSGDKYLADLSVSHIVTNGSHAQMIGLISDVSERKLFERQVEEHTRYVEQAVETHTRELRHKNRLLDRQLATIFDTSLAAASLDEQATTSCMIAAAAEMFECQGSMLRLIGRNPQGQAALVLREAYGCYSKHQESVEFLDLNCQSRVVDAFLCRHVRTCDDVQDTKQGQEVHFAALAREFNLHSMVCFPLVVKDKALGTWSLYRQAVRPFSTDEIQLGQSLANYLAVTLANLDLYEKISHQATEREEWLNAIHQVSVQLAGFESLGSLMELAAHITKDRLNSEVSSIFLLEDDRLRKKAVAGIEPEWLAEESYGIGEGITGSCLVTANGTKYGRPVLDNAVDQNPQVVKEYLREYQGALESGQVKHLIAVPLNGREAPFGVLRVVNKLDEDSQLWETGFAEGDVNLLNTIACEVAIAVEKARLLEEAQQHMEKLSQLQQASQALLSSLDLQSVLDTIAALAADLADADCAEVILDEKDGLVIGAHSSQDLASLPGRPRPDGRTRQVIDIGTPVIIDEVSDDGTHDPALVAEGVRSYAGVPITGREKVLGVLFVFSLRPCAFRERIPILETFTSQAAIAIQNAKLYELEQKRRGLAETLRETSEVVGSTLNLDRVLVLILDQVRRVVSYDTASVQLLAGGELEIIACRGFDRPDKVLGLTFPMDLDFPNYHVVMSKKPYIVENVRSKYPYFEDECYQATHVRSWLGVPLLFKGQVIGMITLDSKTVDYYDREHAQLVMAFANQAAMAIENARLHEKVQSRLSESTALVEVSKSLLAVLERQDLLQLVINSAVKLIEPAEGGMIHLFDKDTKKLQPKAWLGADPASVEKATLMEMGQGIAGQVIEKLEIVNIQDVSKDPQFDESARASYFSSLLVAPVYVRHGEKRIGTLSVHSKTVGAFTDSHERLLATLASQAATAIANAGLFYIRQRKREQLEKTLEVNKDFAMDIGIDALLERIAEAAGEILDFNMVALKLVDSTGQNLIVRALGGSAKDGKSEIIGSATPLEIKNLMQEECRISNSYLIHPGHEVWGRIVEWRTDTPDSTSQARAHWDPDVAVLVPLRTQDDQLVGVLVLCGPRWHQIPSKDDVQVAEIFASAASVAIENARLYEAEKRRATQMKVINEVAQDVTSVLELKELLPRVVEAIQRGFDYHHVALFLLNDLARELVVCAISGAYADVMPLDHHISLRHGMVGRAACTGETQLANDVKKDKHYIQGFPAAEATQAELAVPLELAGHIIGVLDIQSDQLNAFDEMDVLAMETLSDQTAAAIGNARLFSRVQELKEFSENIVQAMEGGVLLENAEGYIRFVNPSLERMLGCFQAELVGHDWSKIIPPEWEERVAEERKEYPQGVKGHYEAALLHRNGTEVPVVVNANPLFERGEFVGVLTVFTDIRETKRRLEDELHEAMNFFHAGVMLGIETAKDRLKKGHYKPLKAELEQLWRASRHTYSELDKILLDLRDPILEKQGLGPALEKYAGLVARDLVSVKDDYKNRLRPSTEHALFRIAQGGITNAVRHAGLEQVSGGKVLVRLTREGENINLSIEDNGRGFDVRIMDKYTRAFGLVRMQEWATVLGTTLQIESAPGKGTKVMVTIPAEGVLSG